MFEDGAKHIVWWVANGLHESLATCDATASERRASQVESSEAALSHRHPVHEDIGLHPYRVILSLFVKSRRADRRITLSKLGYMTAAVATA